MKKLLLSIAMLSSALTASAQTPTTQTSTFEDVTLPNYHNKVYNDSTGGGGFTSRNAYFPTQWDTSYGGYWASGWAASAFHDSTPLSSTDYTNIYGCAAYWGYANSNTFAIGTTGGGSLTLKLTDSLLGKTVSGMYVCNSTYAYNSMKYGDSYEPVFTAHNKDWFKLTIRNYHGGVMALDSAEVYLADFRYADTTQNYIVKSWMWVNLSSLGNTDSLAFFLSSSQNGMYGMNTPAFFCIDNLELSTYLDTTGLGIKSYSSSVNDLNVYPNPTIDATEIVYNTTTSVPVNMKLVELLGNAIVSQRAQSFAGVNKFKIDVSYLPAGVYYVTLNAGNNILTRKLIKQ